MYRTTLYTVPKQVEAITHFPLPTYLKELRRWLGKHFDHYVTNLAGELVTLRKLLKKGEPFVITKKVDREFKAANLPAGNNILLNSFYVRIPQLIITEASGDGFEHILLQENAGKLAGSSSSRWGLRL